MIACAVCGEALEPDARFCEACGAEVTVAAAVPGAPAVPPVLKDVEGPADGGSADPESEALAGSIDDGSAVLVGEAVVVCSACGGRIAADGYCEQCGRPAPNPRDHWSEAPAAGVGGVCDRGIRHAANEDAIALGSGAASGGDDLVVLVVCDGVSSTPGSALASLAAARAARDSLLADREADAASGTVPDAPVAGDALVELWSSRLTAATALASTAITAAIGDLARSTNPPSCTFTAAIALGPLVLTAQIGDSRAYWFPDAGPAAQLTTDDSWAQEMIALGLPREQAEASPQAHSITRWMGADSADETPRVRSFSPQGAGWLLVCSDGLWNYASSAEALAVVVRDAERTVTSRGPGAGDPVLLAEALVAWANARGGHDNITVGLARRGVVPGPSSPSGAGTGSGIESDSGRTTPVR